MSVRASSKGGRIQMHDHKRTRFERWSAGRSLPQCKHSTRINACLICNEVNPSST